MKYKFFTFAENTQRLREAFDELAQRHADLKRVRHTMAGAEAVAVDNWLGLIYLQALTICKIIARVEAGKIKQVRTLGPKADYECAEAEDLIRRTARYF